MRGEQVTSLKRLCELANEKRSVSVNDDGKLAWLSFKHKPASFVMSMQGRLIQQMFDRGMFVYEKEEKKK